MRKPLPKPIQEAPTLHMGLQLFYEAFWDLDTSRSTGMGIGYIPWFAVNQYADVNGFDEDQKDELFFHIRAMDHAYVQYHSEKAEK